MIQVWSMQSAAQTSQCCCHIAITTCLWHWGLAEGDVLESACSQTSVTTQKDRIFDML